MNCSNQEIRKRKRQRKILCRKISKILLIIAVVVVIGCIISKQVTVAEPIPEMNSVVEFEEITEITEVPEPDPEPEALPEPRIECSLDDAIQHMIYEKCQEYNIDFAFTMAMIKQESGFRSDAVSSTNDYGLMQINKCNHEWLSKTLGITDFLDPEQNVTAGLYMITNLLVKYKNPNLALMAYNMGEGGAKKKWDQGIYTSAYADSILAQADEYIKEIY